MHSHDSRTLFMPHCIDNRADTSGHVLRIGRIQRRIKGCYTVFGKRFRHFEDGIGGVVLRPKSCKTVNVGIDQPRSNIRLIDIDDTYFRRKMFI